MTKKKLEIVTGRKVEFDDKKVVTGKFRLSYPHLFKPKAVQQGQEPKFSISMLFDKSSDLSQLEIAAKNAAIEKWGADQKQWPSKKIKSAKTGKIINKSLVKMPFKDGETEHPDKPEYQDVIFFNASSKKQPAVFDRARQPIIEGGAIKAGDYCVASLIAFAYDNQGSYGVSFALQGVQKVENGEALGGGSVVNDFEDLGYDENDEGAFSSEEEEDLDLDEE